MKPAFTIPENIIDMCRQFADVARKLGLHEFSGKFRPPYDVWDAEVSFYWKEGRHGEESNMIHVTSQFFVNSKVIDKDKPLADLNSQTLNGSLNN